MGSIVDTLPLEILEIIFSFLHLDDRIRFSRTCKWFYDAAYHIEEFETGNLRSVVAMRKIRKITDGYYQKWITLKLRRLIFNGPISEHARYDELDVRGVRYLVLNDKLLLSMTDQWAGFVALTTLYITTISISQLTNLLEVCKNLRFLKAKSTSSGLGYTSFLSFQQRKEFFHRQTPLSTSLKSLLFETEKVEIIEKIIQLCPNVDEIFFMKSWAATQCYIITRPIRIMHINYYGVDHNESEFKTFMEAQSKTLEKVFFYNTFNIESLNGPKVMMLKIQSVPKWFSQHAAHIETLYETINWNLCSSDDFPLMPNLKTFHGNLYRPMDLFAPSLEKLVVFDNETNSSLIQSVLSPCRHLRKITFGCDNINVRDLDTVFSNNPYLEEIGIDRQMSDECTIYVLNSISTHCKNAKKIFIGRRISYTKNVLKELSADLESKIIHAFTLLGCNCPGLKYVSGFLDYSSRCFNDLKRDLEELVPTALFAFGQCG